VWAYLVIGGVDEREGGLFLRQQSISLAYKPRKKDVHHDVIAIVGGFLARFFQVSLQLLDGLVESTIIAETFRLEQTLFPEPHIRKEHT
jgi:hypothetical protein